MHRAERLHREQQVAGAATAEQGGLHGEDPVVGTGLLGREVEGRADEDVPEAVDLLLALAEAEQELAERPVGVLLRGQSPQPEGHARDPEPGRQGQVRVPEEPQSRPHERLSGVLVDHGQRERLAPERLALADPLDEAPVLREATERDVLAVVGRRRRVALALGQRLDGAPERRSRLVEDDLVAGVRQFQRRGQAGEPAADDGDSRRP